MGYTNISNDLFLSKQELDRFKEYQDDNGFRLILKKISRTFGIVRDEGTGIDSTLKDFKAVANVPGNSIYFSKDSYAIDINGRIIYFPQNKEIDMYDFFGTGGTNYIYISAAYTNYEKGTVSVSSTGVVSGVSTEFLKTLRVGQFGTKIKFNKPGGVTLNTGEYDIASISSDTTLTLSGLDNDFQVETGLEYAVIGAFTPSIVPSASEKYVYYNDYCTITKSPLSSLADNKTIFLIASALIDVSGQLISVTDLRSSYWGLKKNGSIEKFNTALPSSGLLKEFNPISCAELNIFTDSAATFTNNSYFNILSNGAVKGDIIKINFSNDFSLTSGKHLYVYQDYGLSTQITLFDLNDSFSFPAITAINGTIGLLDITFIFNGSSWEYLYDNQLYFSNAFNFDEWNAVSTFESGWSASMTPDILVYKLSSENFLEIQGIAFNDGSGGAQIFTLTAGYILTQATALIPVTIVKTDSSKVLGTLRVVNSTGQVYIDTTEAMADVAQVHIHVRLRFN